MLLTRVMYWREMLWVILAFWRFSGQTAVVHTFLFPQTPEAAFHNAQSDPYTPNSVHGGIIKGARKLSNFVSNFLESVAHSMDQRFESISSEDMLCSSKEANQKIMEFREKWMEKRREKLRCTDCGYGEEQIQEDHLDIVKQEDPLETGLDEETRG